MVWGIGDDVLIDVEAYLLCDDERRKSVGCEKPTEEGPFGGGKLTMSLWGRWNLEMVGWEEEGHGKYREEERGDESFFGKSWAGLVLGSIKAVLAVMTPSPFRHTLCGVRRLHVNAIYH